MRCCACRENEGNPHRTIAGHAVCNECFEDFKTLKKEDRPMAQVWIEQKLGRNACKDKGRGSLGMR